VNRSHRSAVVAFLFLSPAAFQLFSSANIDFSAGSGGVDGWRRKLVRRVRVRAPANGKTRLCGDGPPRAPVRRSPAAPLRLPLPKSPNAICIPRTPLARVLIKLSRRHAVTQEFARRKIDRESAFILCVQRLKKFSGFGK